MKLTVFLSCLIAGSGFLYHSSRNKAEAPVKTYSYTTTKAARTSMKPISPVKVVIDKSDYELMVYDAKGWYATYPVVFGNNSLADKCMEGDRCTPEGNFRIISKRVHDKWSRFMGINYPNEESLAKINDLKRRGVIPKNSSPGGAIGIHGTWPRDDYMIDRYSNWTNGCIALKNSDVQELYNYIPVGTPVTIRR